MATRGIRVEAEERYQVLLAYLKMCIETKDWHGARDAIVDIEKLEVEIDTSH